MALIDWGRMAGPQLEMICDNLVDLPPIPSAIGYTLRTFRPGDEAGWCDGQFARGCISKFGRTSNSVRAPIFGAGVLALRSGRMAPTSRILRLAGRQRNFNSGSVCAWIPASWQLLVR